MKVKQSTMRIESGVFERADALIDYFNSMPYAQVFSRAGSVTRSSVLRIAIDRGLTELEHEAKESREGPKTSEEPTGEFPRDWTPEEEEEFRLLNSVASTRQF